MPEIDPLGENTYKKIDPRVLPYLDQLDTEKVDIGFHLEGGMYGAAMIGLILVTMWLYHALSGPINAVVDPQVHRLFTDTSHLAVAGEKAAEGAVPATPPAPAP